MQPLHSSLGTSFRHPGFRRFCLFLLVTLNLVLCLHQRWVWTCLVWFTISTGSADTNLQLRFGTSLRTRHSCSVDTGLPLDGVWTLLGLVIIFVLENLTLVCVLWICLPPSPAGLCEFGLLQNEHGDLWMVEIWTVSLNVSRVLQIDSYSLCLEAFVSSPVCLFVSCLLLWLVCKCQQAGRESARATWPVTLVTHDESPQPNVSQGSRKAATMAADRDEPEKRWRVATNQRRRPQCPRARHVTPRSQFTELCSRGVTNSMSLRCWSEIRWKTRQSRAEALTTSPVTELAKLSILLSETGFPPSGKPSPRQALCVTVA